MQIVEGAARTDLPSDLAYPEGWPFPARGKRPPALQRE